MNDVLIFDIETLVFGKPDPSKDRLRIFGCYSYKTNKYYLLTDKKQIQKIINAHKFLVGFNNVGTKFEPGYDNPILIREGINFKYKILIDLKSIFKQRASQMKIDKGLLGDLLMKYSLKYITETLGIVKKEDGKMDIDYKLFQKKIWTKEETELVSKYTKRDVEVTKKLYEFVEDYFVGFKEYLPQVDVDKKRYLTMSLAGLAYKAICKGMNWEEKYNKEGKSGDERIAGGYVAYPAGEKFEGDIYIVDWNSLYSHIMRQCNLYGRKIKDSERPVWSGGGKWKVEGTYFSDNIAGVGKLLKSWYDTRVLFKSKGDKREYSLKIFLNIVYGILNNAYYELVYDRVAGGDCTRVGRQWIIYTRKILRENGYRLIMTDTDSVAIFDKFKDKEKFEKVLKKIEDDIKATVPFPQDTFKLEIEEEIKYIYFFKGKKAVATTSDKEFMEDDDDFVNKHLNLQKKNYVYVTKDDKVVVKNLGIKKKSTSRLTTTIFWKHLVPKIIKGQVKFSKIYLKDLISKELEKDILLASLRKEVGNLDQYKNETCLPAQIAKRYNSGIHFLIPNLRGLGVGKGKSFCTVEEFKERGLKIEDINLDNVWKELIHFTKPVVDKDIFSFGKKEVKINVNK